jgi:hypothetical protein
LIYTQIFQRILFAYVGQFVGSEKALGYEEASQANQGLHGDLKKTRLTVEKFLLKS